MSDSESEGSEARHPVHSSLDAHWTPAQEIERLREDNAILRSALRNHHDEFIALQQGASSAAGLAGTQSQGSLADPFRSPSPDEDMLPGMMMGDSDAHNGLTLEGTLESLRIQTEQLIELNEDFQADQRRWSGRLGLGQGTYSVPLRAA